MKKKIGTAMVVGAGVSGIRSALDLAELGYSVTLVDKAPHIGGILSQLDYQFPNDGCGMCKMLPLVNRDASSQYCLRKGLFHDNIDIVTSARLTAIEGESGNFKAYIEQKPAAVDPKLCIGCGQCATVCPVDVPDEFNMDLDIRKAIYLPVPHNIPNSYVIDLANCTRCEECVKICPTGAVKLPEEKRKNFHILVVDDELIVRDSLKEWLEDEGFAVDVADSGQSALEILSQTRCHLMLTDIKMPGMDGVELLEQAKKKFPDLPVVMMTAYATVETAVQAMKTGALDYLLKPFHPETFTPKLHEIYQSLEITQQKVLDVNAVIFSTGTDYFNPLYSKNTFGYGIYPDIVTSREFERLLSGTGPEEKILLRRSDSSPVRRIAWFQCVGSRDTQTGSEFCSSVCCMHAIKQARLVKNLVGREIDTQIFYMDMRTFGKSFFQYQDSAENDYGIKFNRSRVHSVIENIENGRLQVRYADASGECRQQLFDMIVLSVGQRPCPENQVFASLYGLTLNEYGFCQPEPFSTSRSGRDGIFLGGSFSGLNDISESIIRSSAASSAASRFIHSNGGSLSSDTEDSPVVRDVSQEPPRILVAVCTCQDSLFKQADMENLRQNLLSDPYVKDVVIINSTCTSIGWSELTEKIEKTSANRILIGACLPCVYTRKKDELALKAGIYPDLINVVDIHSKEALLSRNTTDDTTGETDEKRITDKLKTGFSSLKRIDPSCAPLISPVQKALVVGGGAAGLAACLAIANHGFEVHLIEKQDTLGGNLCWLKQTIQGDEVQPLLENMVSSAENHPLVTIHLNSQITGSFGNPGNFVTTVHDADQDTPLAVEHGITILATGGTEAETSSYSHGTCDAVVTHKQLEQQLTDETINPADLNSVVMIQCVDSREQKQKAYCSRICCTSALKNALQLKKINPEIQIYICYRDIMTYGFLEKYYTKARNSGIIFVQYKADNKPEVTPMDGKALVKVFEPILEKNIQIDADLVVLATGVVPALSESLAENFGAGLDGYGFFQEAESKWRPVDSLKEGVFACGLSHSPRNITETIASAEAAAQRGLRIISSSAVKAGTVVADIHHSLCSLCERCIDTCPYGARSLDKDLNQVEINPVMCQGCGVCAAVCPNSASTLTGFNDQQMFDVIDSLF